MTDDHRLARDLAGQAGRRLLGLRAQGGDPDVLRKAVPWFRDPQVAAVQLRWGFLNESYSLLTRLQAFVLRVHFFVEQRNWSRGVYWYARRFVAGADAKARGEASVLYTQHPQLTGTAVRGQPAATYSRCSRSIPSSRRRRAIRYQCQVRVRSCSPQP